MTSMCFKETNWQYVSKSTEMLDDRKTIQDVLFICLYLHPKIVPFFQAGIELCLKHMRVLLICVLVIYDSNSRSCDSVTPAVLDS